MTPTGVDWKRNLAALWFAEFTAIFGFAFAFPFLPIFLKSMGIDDAGQLAQLTGLAAGAAGFSQAVMGPVWGVVADRFGRKSMLIRAMAGGAITVGLMGLSQAPWQLVVLRLIQGATSGTVAAATTIVAAETPRGRVGWALGVLSSSIAVGGAVGPVVGGILAAAVGVKTIFLLGGFLLMLSILPVALVVRESGAGQKRNEAPPAALATLRAAGPGTLAAIAVILVAQALVQVSYSAFQPLVVLRFLEIAAGSASSLTGLTFGIAGLASAAASVSYSEAARRWGYRRGAIATAAVLAVAEAAAGVLSPAALIVVTGGVAGFFYGVVGPSLNAMLGLETPPAVQARVFGFSSSAIAIGFGVGPLLGGEVAAVLDVSTAVVIASTFALLTAAVLTARAREPAR